MTNDASTGPLDLLVRLRALAKHEHDDLAVADEAADEIERLRLMLEGRAAGMPIFCWLIELFEPHGNSMGYYHTGFTDLDGWSRTTKRPHDAKRYSTREEAEQVAEQLHHLAGVWKAVEHGFVA